MGLLGPKIMPVASKADKDDGAAPYNLIDNPHSLLDLTDIVFIDPIGTGYSDVLGEGKVEDYWGLYEDSRSVATFIRSWITQYKRWNSPKYIAGESFGTTRAAAVAQDLMGGGQDVALNGIIMISQALDYAGSTSDHYNITSYLTYLPAMAATAWYHKKAGAGQSLNDFVDKARRFTYDRYAPALYRGDFLSESDKTALAHELSTFIGLSEKYILQSNLRVLVPRFQKELLRDEGKTIGRLDGRYFGEEADIVAENPTLGDPASYRISSAYTAALNDYFSNELKVKLDRPYLTSNGKIYNKWNWRPGGREDMSEPSYVNTAPRLGNAMRKNEALKVLVASGYYDLITPFFDAEYTFSRNGIPINRIDFKYFEAGHMMYVHHPDFNQLCNDIREFMLEH
jgi:carboxypeptidase C (cathepsin A)